MRFGGCRVARRPADYIEDERRLSLHIVDDALAEVALSQWIICGSGSRGSGQVR
jgi:hypothetical protein